MAQWIANLLLLLALAAAVWYAWETRKMRLQMIRPKLVFLAVRHHAEHLGDTQVNDLSIRNIGAGAALNVSIGSMQYQAFSYASSQNIFRY